MNKWENLEEEVKTLLTADLAQRTPLSGGTKKEEDVVGRTIFAQCKQTNNKNGTILLNDLNRLLEACNLQNRFPLFFNEFNSNTTLSIPITDETKDIISKIIKIIIISKSMEKLELELKRVGTLRDLTAISVALNEPIRLMKTLWNEFNTSKKRIDTRINTIQDDILMHDLFEGENNGTK